MGETCEVRQSVGTTPVSKDLLKLSPFNLKGGRWYIFLFRSDIFFRTTRELEYVFFFCRDYIFFLPPKSEYFFQQHWESEYFF